jgi:hypothetical protein
MSLRPVTNDDSAVISAITCLTERSCTTMADPI